MVQQHTQIQSNAQQPDLDWSQIRETVSMLTAATASVERAMGDGNSSMNTLAESFTCIVEHIAEMDKVIETMEDGEQKSLLMRNSAATSEKIQISIIDFQFYDKLQQRLEHVSSSLTALAEIVSTPDRLYNPSKWRELQQFIRSRFTIESDIKMFDAIMQGESVDQAVSLATEQNEANDGSDIELF